MIRASLLALFTTLMICGFCGKEFVSLGRHSWRCKSKVKFEQDYIDNVTPAMENTVKETLPIVSYKAAVKCCCGKVCKGARGLKMHQRSCRVIEDLQDELQQQMTDSLNQQEIKKEATKSTQYLPKLFIRNELVPRVKIGESFCYLGRYFDFHMTDEDPKSEINDTLNNMLKEIDELPLHPKNKILLYNRYLLSKISWHFTVSDITKTWVNENLDNIACKYIRKWLELPISATISNVLLPCNKFGLNIILPSTKFLQCLTVSRQALKSSPNQEINRLWKETSDHKNIQYDIYDISKTQRTY